MLEAGGVGVGWERQAPWLGDVDEVGEGGLRGRGAWGVGAGGSWGSAWRTVMDEVEGLESSGSSRTPPPAGVVHSISLETLFDLPNPRPTIHDG